MALCMVGWNTSVIKAVPDWTSWRSNCIKEDQGFDRDPWSPRQENIILLAWNINDIEVALVSCQDCCRNGFGTIKTLRQGYLDAISKKLHIQPYGLPLYQKADMT